MVLDKNENQKENNISLARKEDKITNMVIRVIGGRTYYTRKDEAEAVRRKGDRIYYEPGAGYYIVRVRLQGRDPFRIF
jgi:hypothetical protein